MGTNSKTLLLALAMFCTLATKSALANDSAEFTACGADADEARAELGKNLIVGVETRFQRQTNTAENGIFDFFSTHTSVQHKQTSNIFLCNTKTEQEVDGRYCAKVGMEELQECAQKKLDQQLRYSTTNLPDASTARLTLAQQWMDDINQSRGLYTVVGQVHLGIERLHQLISIEKALMQELHTQFVRFNVKGGEATITVDNDTKIPIGRDVALENGKHSYRIESIGHCPIDGEFELHSLNKHEVSHDLDGFRFPELSFQSNLADIELMVDGKKESVGTYKVINRCEGTVAYAYTYQEVTKTGQVKLKPGMRQKIYRGFSSKQIIGLVDKYKRGSYWLVHYENYLPAKSTLGIRRYEGVRISRHTLNDYFRKGWQFAYVSGKNGSYMIDYSASFRLQLLDFKNATSVLHLGSFVFIPHIGIEAGISYRKIGNSKNFSTIDIDRMDRDFKKIVVMRPSIGVDTTFNSGFTFSAIYGKNLYINQENTFSLGMGFRFW
ncbi:MAG: hypothetical protein OEZ43_04480 [Gammaproteobacteria bacterium]|nr:hypothetical protein [Gammaproteobacteria bacterium]